MVAGTNEFLRVDVLARMIGPVKDLRVLGQEGVLAELSQECAVDVKDEGARKSW